MKDDVPAVIRSAKKKCPECGMSMKNPDAKLCAVCEGEKKMMAKGGKVEPEMCPICKRKMAKGGKCMACGGKAMAKGGKCMNCGGKVMAKGGKCMACGGKAHKYAMGGSVLRRMSQGGEMEMEMEDDTPAALSEGEYVVPADVVSMLGDGNTDAGAKVLEQFIAKIRKDKGKHLAKGKQAPPLS